MSEGETTLADQQGKFTQVVTDGRKVPDIEWIGGRILLSNKRLVLASNEGKRTIPLSKIGTIRGRQDATQPLAQVSNYLSLQVGNDVTLIAPNQHEAFERALYNAVLDRATVAVKHPAVEGGVVQETGWSKARIKITDEDVKFALADGDLVVVDRDDIGEVETEERTVLNEERRIIEVEHTEDGISVETYVTGDADDVSVLERVLEEGVERNRADLDLGPVEKQVVMALHSGVSPFEIPDFVGADVEEIEAIYDRLIELEVIEVVRERTEVEMTAQGRSVAGQTMGEQ